MNAFDGYELRTTSVRSAAAFYADVLGFDVRESGEVAQVFAGRRALGAITRLPQRAAALGAPSHWLGHVGVVDHALVSARMVASGGAPLGPPRHEADGSRLDVFRDPLGSVVALASVVREPIPDAVAWHELHTGDLERAFAVYASLFGWVRVLDEDLGLSSGPAGPYRTFAWTKGAPAIGAIVATAVSPRVHPHWLFYFKVADIDGVSRNVKASGGRVPFGIRTMPSGARAAPCEDAQGAAFGVWESAAR
jgi:predicted enzyme related to lactoylglutathione lyase